MRDARASNWVLEKARSTVSGFELLGTSSGYTSFKRAFKPSDDVFYSAQDESGNREAGWATFDGTNLVGRAPTATLYNGAYSGSSPSKVQFSGKVTIACTFNASAFNILWKALEAIDPDGDGNINIPPELIDGLADALRKKADQVDLEAEIEARKDGDQHLQDQIDDLENNSLSSVKWSEIEDKPQQINALGVQNIITGGSF